MEFIESFKIIISGCRHIRGNREHYRGNCAQSIIVYSKTTYARRANDIWDALKSFYDMALNTNNRNDILFLLILACTLLVLCCVFIALLLIRIYIGTHVLHKYGFGLALSYSWLFLLFYGVYKAIWSISDLTKAVCAKRGIDFGSTMQGNEQ